MIQSTRDYEMFRFRDDNREKIDQAHVRRLIESIKARNLLDLRPILVNEMMEVIDGQHRLLAAKMLGVEVYYQKEKKLGANEVMLMNTAKAWTCGDYLNFYCKNGYKEYQKLQNFMKKHNLNLRVALNICMGAGKYSYSSYKNGEFQFEDQQLDKELEVCWDTIDFIKKMNGFSAYTSSSRFWRAMIKLTTHYNFDAMKWRANLQKMVERFTSKATTDDYCRLMMDVYNWRNNDKISLLDEV